jgi:hypothetical protein
VAKTVFDVLKDRLQEEIDVVSTHLAFGKAGDYADYKELCGQIRGLRTAQSLVVDLAKNFMDEDDD